MKLFSPIELNNKIDMSDIRNPTRHYPRRLKITVDENKTISLFSKSGIKIITGYERIVLGRPGPMVELTEKNFDISHFYIPSDQKWRIENNKGYFDVFLSLQNDVKMIKQKKLIDYADYKVGFYYISPFQLYFKTGEIVIDPIKKKECI